MNPIRFPLSHLFSLTLIMAVHAVAAAHSNHALVLVLAVTVPVALTAGIARWKGWEKEVSVVVSGLAAFLSCFTLLFLGASNAWFTGQAGIPIGACMVFGCIYGGMGSIAAGAIQYLIRSWASLCRWLLLRESGEPPMHRS
ncbi:MAG: hypothetical protein ACE361_06785 [Aureliella sp.]